MTKPEKRDAGVTADRIRSAAQEVFGKKGYDAATTREIADKAGVNLALINRYFGSKLGLFEKAVLPHLSLEPFLDLDQNDLVDRLLDVYVDPAPKPRFDAFEVLVRSMTSDEAGPLMVETLVRQALQPMQDRLDGKDVEARAILITTQLAGLIFYYRIMKLRPHAPETTEALRSRLGQSLHGILAG